MMTISIYKDDDRLTVTVNGRAKIFETEEAALEFLESLVRETRSVVDSVREMYFAMK